MKAPAKTSRLRMTLRRFVPLVVLACALTACTTTQQSREKTGKHLFILSGQSNMTGSLKSGFEQRVIEHFGQENVTVVMRSKGGRGIRFWVPEYRQPGDRGLTPKKMNSNGEEYPPLIEAVRTAADGQSFDTVGFVWMQGESDANNRLSEVYEKSFHMLIEQLENDLGRDDLYFVIGRINDYAKSRPDNEHWKRVRETQVKLGSTPGNGWVNTDDLNREDNGQPQDYIHFPREGAVVVGQRMAEKAIELIERH